MEPSSTSTISKLSPVASITALRRSYRSVTFSCSLCSGTTMEYFGMEALIIRENVENTGLTFGSPPCDISIRYQERTGTRSHAFQGDQGVTVTAALAVL